MDGVIKGRNHGFGHHHRLRYDAISSDFLVKRLEQRREEKSVCSRFDDAPEQSSPPLPDHLVSPRSPDDPKPARFGPALEKVQRLMGGGNGVGRKVRVTGAGFCNI